MDSSKTSEKHRGIFEVNYVLFERMLIALLKAHGMSRNKPISSGFDNKKFILHAQIIVH
jgi:hypothetical protein